MTFSARGLVNIVLVLLLALVPAYAWATGNGFAVTLMTRALIYAIAATSLNLILGYGGMVSFGHAMFIGIGGYAVGILAAHGNADGIVQLPLAILISGLIALLVGALSLRTHGVYFIMITLAFAQMIYFVGVGLDWYGADDGMALARRTRLGPIDLADKMHLYYLCLLVLLAMVGLTWRIVNSRFGMVIRGAKANEVRMHALGFPVFRYRLAALVIAGAMGGLAGALMANQAAFVSPAMMHWVQSGDLIVMVVVGGVGTLFGPLYGAIAFLVVEQVLSTWTENWQLIFGPLVVLLVLFGKGGISALIDRVDGRRVNGDV